MDTDRGQEYSSELLVAQALLYYDNSMCDKVVSIGEQVSEESLANRSKQMFYNVMYDCYARVGNEDLSNQYFEKLYDLSDMMSGEEFYQ